MPNWLYLVTNLIYHLGLALWVGGAVALGALGAPVLFKALPRQDAGTIFGTILRRFARVRVGAIVASIVAAGVKFVVWEKHATPWIAIRWAALVFLAAVVLYEIAYLERAMEARRSDREAFAILHKRSEGLMKASLAAALVAMLLS